MTVTLSDGEKLSLLMLCEIYDHLKIKGEFTTDVIKHAIFSGNVWGLEWEYSGVFHSETPRDVAIETSKILAMWHVLENTFERLDQKGKDLVLAAVRPHKLKFPGFDGNDEAEHLSAANFLVNHLGRFSERKTTDLDSHSDNLEAYRRMLAVYDSIGHPAELGAEDLIKIFTA
jgi:hypothetical protein